MVINKERLLFDLHEACKYTDTPENGVTRFSYGNNDKKVRGYLEKIANKYDFSISYDAVGNMYISFNKHKRKIVIGSHIDTVKNGGWLDGIYGVMAGLEVLRVFAENNMHMKDIGIELVIFAEEEGSNFGSTMTGSKFITGIYDEMDFDSLVDSNGTTIRSYLENNFYPVEDIDYIVWPFENIEAMLELHIEQGPILDRDGVHIGVVETIFGMKTLEVLFKGVGNHAGAAPMEGRKDCLAAAAEAICDIEAIALSDEYGQTVATVGRLEANPGSSNVIPESVVFTIDIRDRSNEKIEMVLDTIIGAVRSIENKRGIECEIKEIASSDAVPLDPNIIETMNDVAKEKNIQYKLMDSGAVHDTAMIAKHCKAGMIFVPSIEGRSHVPEEDTKTDDLVMGAQFLLDVVEKYIK